MSEFKLPDLNVENTDLKARVAELEGYIEANTSERDGVRYSKSVAFEGCKRCRQTAAVAERAAIVADLRAQQGGDPMRAWLELRLADRYEAGAHLPPDPDPDPDPTNHGASMLDDLL